MCRPPDDHHAAFAHDACGAPALSTSEGPGRTAPFLPPKGIFHSRACCAPDLLWRRPNERLTAPTHPGRKMPWEDFCAYSHLPENHFRFSPGCITAELSCRRVTQRAQQSNTPLRTKTGNNKTLDQAVGCSDWLCGPKVLSLPADSTTTESVCPLLLPTASPLPPVCPLHLPAATIAPPVPGVSPKRF